jgi:uncharacterized protein YecE (DUF72 family)
MKKLKDPREPLERLLGRVSVLGNKLGPILFQLPPRWRSNSERLEGFLKILPEDQRYAFEFRDPSWFDDKNYELLRNYGSSFCVYDLDGKTSPKRITADFAYVRLHGPDRPYRGRYGRERLETRQRAGDERPTGIAGTTGNEASVGEARRVKVHKRLRGVETER